MDESPTTVQPTREEVERAELAVRLESIATAQRITMLRMSPEIKEMRLRRMTHRGGH